MNPTSYQTYLIHQVQPAMQSPPIYRMEKFKTTIYKLGFTEITLGVMSLFFGMTVVFMHPNIGEGIWCGSVLIACGIVGVVTRSKPSRCMYNANMAMSIISACLMIVLVVIASANATMYFYMESILAVFYSIIAATGLTALIVNIVHSAYCCAGVCCLPSPTQTLVPVQMINGQFVLDPNQINLAAGFTNLAMNFSPDQVSLPPPLHSNVALPGVQSTGSACAHPPLYPDEPPPYMNNSEK